tara:strand:+ start:346 stop:468 length:123 start_codon:yes stop_codon:yes gene_type:complete
LGQVFAELDDGVTKASARPDEKLSIEEFRDEVCVCVIQEN